MSAIHPQVKALAVELGTPRCAHLTPEHQQDYLHGFARSLQVTVDDYFRSVPDDRCWPIDWMAPERAEARKASQALTEAGESIAHAGKKMRAGESLPGATAKATAFDVPADSQASLLGTGDSDAG